MTMFSPEDIDAICSMVASILHLGNIMFVNDPEKDIVYDIANKPVLEIAAKIFGIDADSLSGPLIKRSNVIRGERIFSPLSETTAKDSRDALSKAIYGQLFNFIIARVNEVICKAGNLKFIGVLDIFGFENFQRNSLEQFCINLANEQLQDFFNGNKIICFF
jgi:myosin heavy subunit